MNSRPLVHRMVPVEQKKDRRDYAKKLRTIIVDDVTESDLLQIGIGAYSPLVGMMTEEEYHSVVERMRLPSGDVWSIPVTLPVTEDVATTIYVGEELALVREDESIAAMMHVESLYRPDLTREAEMVYRTQDLAHPGVKLLYARGPVYVGGSIEVFADEREDEFSPYFSTPQQTRERFAALGWKTVMGFQTRNPIHRAHEYIQKAALEIVDGLFLHPLVGPTKDDDVPAEVRLHAYQAILTHYYPRDRVVFGVYKAAMRYAGPREAIMHALVRRTMGVRTLLWGEITRVWGIIMGVMTRRRYSVTSRLEN